MTTLGPPGNEQRPGLGTQGAANVNITGHHANDHPIVSPGGLAWRNVMADQGREPLVAITVVTQIAVPAALSHLTHVACRVEPGAWCISCGPDVDAFLDMFLVRTPVAES